MLGAKCCMDIQFESRYFIGNTFLHRNIIFRCSVPNVLLTSCADNVCRIWLETVKYKPSPASHKYASVRRDTSMDPIATDADEGNADKGHVDMGTNHVADGLDEEKVMNSHSDAFYQHQVIT